MGGRFDLMELRYRDLLPLLLTCAAVHAEWSLFDNGWKFYRGDSRPTTALSADGCAAQFCKSSFDDSSWRLTETPHDWSIEDLPGREADAEFPVLQVREGPRLFSKDDQPLFANKSFDDSNWIHVSVPHDWRSAPTNHTGAGVVGWYRRHISPSSAAQVSAASDGKLKLAVGTVANKAAVYVNGVLIGSTGDLNKTDGGCTEYLQYNSFVVPAGVLSTSSPNVVAIRVRSGSDENQPGGLYDSMAADGRKGPFDPASSPGRKQTGYTVAGVGWYRKMFTATPPPGYRTILRFDGVYMNATVFLNEVQVSYHPYGYTTFEIDITDHIISGPNQLSVRVQSSGSNSRWYAGAGIFRHVHLGSVPAVHARTFGGVQVVSPQNSINLKAKSATVTVTSKVENSGSKAASVTVSAKILSPASISVRRLEYSSVDQVVVVAAGSSVNVTQTFKVTNSQLWSPDHPSLYTATVKISSGAHTDTINQTFGIRLISFDSKDGFQLNGVKTLLRGGCVHHDNGPLGSRAIGRAEERRVELLKAAGYNAIRTSHNPVSPAFVAACDRLGVMLMEEAFDCWDQGKNSEDYHLYFDEWWQRDVMSMVVRDISSPSIIMWSIGNEIPNRGTARGIDLSRQLSDWIRALDPLSGNGRAVTSAYPGAREDNVTDQYLAPLEVAGYNYGWDHYEAAHARVPARVIAGTEAFPLQSFQTWQAVVDNSWVIGDFIWTAIDYIGESAIGGTGFNTPDLRACGGYCPQGWSWHISFCGDIDLVGHRKPQSLYRTVMWNTSQLEIAVHEPVPEGQKEIVASWGWPTEYPSWSWNVAAGTNFSINVYSSYPTVRLFLNGKPLSESPVPTKQYTATFSGVRYEQGDLKAVGYDEHGNPVEQKTITTAAAASHIRLTADRSTIRADRSDLSYVTAEVVDANGILIHTAAVELTFTVSGAGELAAVGSGDPADAGSFYVPTRTTYLGKAVAIVRPGTSKGGAPTAGAITLTASAPGLKGASVTIVVA